jgi:hypothetical protein
MCFNTTKLMHSVLLLASLFLISCGGGGGSASPPTSPPAAPTNVIATPGDGYVLLNGDSVVGATAYNIYWSTTTGVSKSNGTLLPATSTPQAHTGLTNGKTYYYVATAVGAGGGKRGFSTSQRNADCRQPWF